MIEFMGIKIEVVGHGMGKVVAPCHSMAWARIFLTRRPPTVCLKVTIATGSCEDGIVLLVSYGAAARLQEGDSYVLRVAVKWDGDVPHTRLKGEDNVDIIFLFPDGSFRDVQVSLNTNKGQFFANAHRVYKGWVARTRGARVGERRFTFAPNDPANAYPGCDYGEIWESMAEELVEWAIDEGSSVQLSRVKPSTWVSPEVPAPLQKSGRERWRRAEVFFWSMVTQSGLVRDLDSGEKLAVGYRAFQNNIGEPPILCSGAGVYYRPAPLEEGKFPRVGLIRPA